MSVGVPDYTSSIDTAKLWDKVGSSLPGGSSNDVAHTLVHELGHAWQDGNHYHSHEEVAIDYGEVGAHVARDVLNVPESQSSYGTTTEFEDDAEAFAVALYTKEGPEHPDEVRRFSSGANKKVIKTLYAIEKEYPGITDYLVSKNPNLINRGALAIGDEGNILPYG